MAETRADTLIEQYGKFSPMSVNEADAMANKVFGQNPADQEEAEILLGASGLFDQSDVGWRHIVTQQLRRYLLQDLPRGELQDGAEDWLIATLATAQVEKRTALELIQDIMLNADNASERLGRIGLRSALASMKAVATSISKQKANTG